MSEVNPNTNHSQINKTFRRYLVGFAVSIVLTLLAFGLVLIHVQSHHQIFSHLFLYISIGILAILQVIAQLFLFLHLGDETSPRWRLWIFLFALMVILIIVAGSLWIMQNLNYRMMPSNQQIINYMNNQSGL